MDERDYKSPVAWLGGRDLLANVKYFALFAAFKGKLDLRDWMNAEVFPSTSLPSRMSWRTNTSPQNMNWPESINSCQ